MCNVQPVIITTRKKTTWNRIDNMWKKVVSKEKREEIETQTKVSEMEGISGAILSKTSIKPTNIKTNATKKKVDGNVTRIEDLKNFKLVKTSVSNEKKGKENKVWTPGKLKPRKLHENTQNMVKTTETSTLLFSKGRGEFKDNEKNTRKIENLLTMFENKFHESKEFEARCLTGKKGKKMI